MKAFIKEFKEFISRGSVLDMAVGIIIGGAFTSIVKSLVDDIINPLLGLFGGMNFDLLTISFILRQILNGCHQLSDYGTDCFRHHKSNQSFHRKVEKSGNTKKRNKDLSILSE